VQTDIHADGQTDRHTEIFYSPLTQL